jgi:hypothetical protein
MREICTSGSVGGREGNLPVYPTADAAGTPRRSARSRAAGGRRSCAVTGGELGGEHEGGGGAGGKFDH